MRIGVNPQKNVKSEEQAFYHQIIIPVYIPNQEGYFKDSFAIFKFCLESLFRTCHEKTYYTIVDNGSCTEVSKFLKSLQEEGKLQELITTDNIGKINAVFKGVSGHSFPLVTITDADVLFLSGWQEETYRVFNAFPKAGFVSPVPIPKLLKYHTYGPIMKYLFSGKLQFTTPEDPQALLDFASSIENKDFYKKVHLDNYLTITTDSVKAVLGAGHFVATYRREVFTPLKEHYTPYKLDPKSDRPFLDQPVSDRGYWRLATAKNLAYHMGNVVEDWMSEVLNELESGECKVRPELAKPVKRTFLDTIQRFIYHKFLLRRPIWKWFLKRKGLSKKEAKLY